MFNTFSSLDSSILPRVSIAQPDSQPLFTNDDGITGNEYFASIAGEQYIFSFSRRGYKSSIQTLVFYSDLIIPLQDSIYLAPHTGAFTGVILDSLTFAPISNVKIEAIEMSGDFSTNFSDNFGNYKIYADSGQWTFAYSTPGYITKINAFQNIDHGDYITLPQIQMVENSGYFEITVLDTILFPNSYLQGVIITGVRMEGGDTTAIAVPGITGADGQYSFIASTGLWRVTASKNGYVNDFIVDSVYLGLTSTRIIILDHLPGGIYGTVYSNDSLGLPGANITYSKVSNGGKYDSTITGVSGNFTITVLPDSYYIEVSKPGYISQTETIFVSPGQTKFAGYFYLTPDIATITGTVIGSDSLLLSNTWVFITTADSQVIGDSTNIIGKYTIITSSGSFQLIGELSGYNSDTISVSISPGDTLNLNLFLIKYPNSIIELMPPNENKINNISIIDIHGKVLYDIIDFKLNDLNHKLTNSGLKSGIYFLKIEKNNSFEYKKIILYY